MNSDHAYSSVGPCVEHEFELVEYVDGALATERRAVVQRHLDTCGRCRAFVHDMAAVTESLALALPRVELSAGFDADLRARIAGLSRPVDRAAARALEERQYHGAIQALRRGLTWRTALNAIASASVCGGVLTALGGILPPVLRAFGLAEPTLGATSLGVAAVALFTGIVAAAGLSRQSPSPLLG